mmetsp:Transcript_24033/g.35149  ORF Transcript_24033/g.35149 Transcript_24033/m.35149 type:complete len:206 (-) Transcript_24033:341-958(-)
MLSLSEPLLWLGVDSGVTSCMVTTPSSRRLSSELLRNSCLVLRGPGDPRSSAASRSCRSRGETLAMSNLSSVADMAGLRCCGVVQLPVHVRRPVPAVLRCGWHGRTSRCCFGLRSPVTCRSLAASFRAARTTNRRIPTEPSYFFPAFLRRRPARALAHARALARARRSAGACVHVRARVRYCAVCAETTTNTNTNTNDAADTTTK